MVRRESRRRESRIGPGRRLRSRPGIAIIGAMFAGFVLIAAITGALAGPGAAAGPNPPVRDAPALLAGGCHRDVQRHVVPEFRDTVPHRHRPGDCAPLAARETKPPLDCHRDVRRHPVPGMGVVLHRHVGKDCFIRRVSRSTEPKP